MIAVKGQVTLIGGSVVDFTAGPWEFSKWEEYASRHQLSIETAPITFSMYLAFAAANREQWPPSEGYERWAQGVKDIDMEDPDEPRPTEKAKSAD